MSESVADVHERNFTDSYYLLREDSALYPVESVAIVELSGEDRKGWLQGQATNNLRSLDFGASSSFCLCEPTGQILAVCDIWSLRERFILTMPAAALDAFLNRVEQMVIIEDVSARVLDDHSILSIQGPTATSRIAEKFQIPALDADEMTVEGCQVSLLRSNRAGQGGWDVLVPSKSNQASGWLRNTFAEVEHRVAEIARIEAGIPKFGADITPKTMPPELGQQFESRTVSYNKGCYTGQEVLMRLHSRGHTNKTWMGLVADEPFEVGSAVSHPRRSDAGVVSSAAFSPAYGYIGAATLRNEAAHDGEWVSISSANGAIQAEVREMPIWRLE